MSLVLNRVAGVVRAEKLKDPTGVFSLETKLICEAGTVSTPLCSYTQHHT